MAAPEYKLEDLAEKADVSVRTVRYYLQRGLLPAPEFRGKDTAYGPEHLTRLRAIKRLQADYLPLDAIAAELERRNPRELEKLAAGAATASPATQAPRATPAASPARREAEKWSRLELAPGVEVWIADSVSERARARALAACQRIAKELEGEDR